MMTRREKLLVRPWQLRRYNNHKKKVLNAVPVVDFGPPPQRTHVTVKLKKLQKEKERQEQIEEDNFRLLQHLGSIMRQKRIDDHWETKLPTFLRRVGIYHRTRTPTPYEETVTLPTPEFPKSRKSKCVACTPRPEPPIVVPEERIPWEPPKKILTRRLSSSAVVPATSDFDFPHLKFGSKNPKCLPKKGNAGNLGKIPELPILSSEKKLSKIFGSERKVVIRQGPIQISVNFPPFSEVKLVCGQKEKFIQRKYCECQSYQRKREVQ